MITWGWVALSVLGSAGEADVLARVRASGELVYCGDQEGGGPYIYPKDDDPFTVVGCDVDLATDLARRLGVRARFQQGPWDKLPEMLHADKCDVVLNGYEWSAARAESLSATIPYYAYELVLLGTGADPKLSGVEALGDQPRRVGVLSGSAAEVALRRRAFPTLEIVTYDGNTDAMREVENGKLDATLQDSPIARFYGPRFPKLKPLGPPIDRGYYVLYAKPTEAALIAELNRAITESSLDGALGAINRRYGIDDPAQEEIATLARGAHFFGVRPEERSVQSATVAETTVALGARPRGLQVIERYGLILLQSAGLTVLLACASFPLAILLGLLVALIRVYGPKPAAVLLTGYVEFLRGTPLMLQLYFLFFFLPELGVNLSAMTTAILGLAINYSAYESEIYRAGLQAVPKGQLEAALSLGMPRILALRRIVVPQAVRSVIPPVMNDFIALFKDTSVCSVVTLVELTKRFSVLSQSTQATIELMVATAILYLLMSYPASRLARQLEVRLGVSE